VVVLDADGKPEKAGVLRPEGYGYVFSPEMAKYAAAGSVAAGREAVFIKQDSWGHPWSGSDGDATDEWVDARIATGELEILRAGYGRFA
jgi:hypothetical protein